MNKYWIWFSRTYKIGAKAQNSLLEKFKKPENIWKLDDELLSQILNKEQIGILTNEIYKQNLDRYEEYMNEHKIKMITIYDKKYPEKLRNIYDPPVVLYIRGNEKILNQKSIAIIGSRQCSQYGQEIAKEFAYNLSKYNINVISGLARGIDTFAHIGAVNAKKTTIAVVGNGLDVMYPKENEKLQEKIIENGGAIISEYPIGTKTEKMNFPARNRIISGLSDGVVVVEAGLRSGTLITVEFALEQGKNVYAIPRKY